MCLHPDIIDVMIAVGVTAEQMAAIIRKAWEVDQRQKAPEPEPTNQSDIACDVAPVAPPVAPVAPTKIPRWKKRRQALRNRGLPAHWRGRLLEPLPATVTVALDVAPVAPPFSSFKKDLSLSGSTRAPNDFGPVPEGWRPTADGWQFAVGLLGNAAAGCLEKFIDYWQAESGPRGRRTEGQWQAAWKKWARAERDYLTNPHLPLMRNMTGARSNGRKSLSATFDELILEAQEYESHRSAPMGTGRAAAT